MDVTHSIRIRMAAISVVSLFVMGYIDYITGYELIFSAAYLVPVSICGWYFGPRAVGLMAAARIKVGEGWVGPEEFLRTRLHLNFSHGISPEGIRAFEAEMKPGAEARSSGR